MYHKPHINISLSIFGIVCFILANVLFIRIVDAYQVEGHLTVIPSASISNPSGAPVQQVFLNMISWGLYKTHMILGSDEFQSEVSTNTLPTLDIIKNMEELLNVDIVQALDVSQDKSQFFDFYLASCDNVLLESNIVIGNMQQDMARIKYDMDYCNQQKISADNDYFAGLKDYNSEKMQDGLNRSLQNAQCASDKKISYNAQQALLNKLTTYFSLLKKKYDFLSLNQKTILNNIEVLETDLLEQLKQINQTLEQFSSIQQ